MSATGPILSDTAPLRSSPASPVQRQLIYLPAIDGLRSIAVLCVLVFHFDRSWLGGGFVGVDIFFVISGFLITSILLSDMAERRFSILRFYQRRIARIFPAFALVLVAVLLVGGLMYQPREFGTLGHDAVAAATSLANVHQAFRGSYLLLPEDVYPLLHYWSLAVEEQFYLLFPVYLLLVMRFARRPLLVTAGLALVSFAIGVVLTAHHPSLAFYLLPPRGWELLAGACLAIWSSDRLAIDGRASVAIVWSGLAFLLASLCLIGPASAFPGWLALLPVGATLLLLSVAGNMTLAPIRLLAAPLPVWIGRLSYSLYLWHWPTFLFVDYRFFGSGDPFRAMLKIALTAGASVATYYWMERPLRSYLAVPHRRMLAFGAFLVLSTAIGGASLWIWQRFAIDAAPSSVATGGVHFAGGGKGTVMLVGDSLASMYANELVVLGRKRGFALDVVSISGSDELPGSANWPSVINAVRERRPDVIILAERWDQQLANSDKALRMRPVEPVVKSPARLTAAITALAPYVHRIILLGQPRGAPVQGSRAGARHGARPPFAEPAEFQRRRTESENWVSRIAQGKVRYFPIEHLFTARDGSVQLFDADGRWLYINSSHLSDLGAHRVVDRLDAEIADGINDIAG